MTAQFVNVPFLIEMGWKSALIAALALLLVTLLRGRAPADRSALLRIAVAALLLLPVVAVALPALQVEAFAPAEVPQAVADPAPTAAAAPSVIAADRYVAARGNAFDGQADPLSLPDLALLAGLAYLAGLMVLAARFGIGLATLARWTREGAEVTDPRWVDATARRNVPGMIVPRVVVSDSVPAPLSWGFLNPVILIDRTSIEDGEDAEAIIAHEMAHIARRDWPALVMTRLAVTLFWFNPLIWILERNMIQQAEEAADARVLKEVEAARYAQTLVACARHRAGTRLPANSIAGTGLRRRIKAILEGRSIPAGSRWTMLAMVACIGFAAPVAALQLIPAAAPRAPVAPVAANAPAAPTAPAAPIAPLAALAGVHATAQESAMSNEEGAHTAAEARAAATEAQEAAAEAAREAAEAAAEATQMFGPAFQEAIAEVARAGVMAGMAAGADGMLKGADAMEKGAVKMREEAENLKRADYRDTVIAKAKARGETVTHEELIEASAEMAEGADEMREGAAEMRTAAAEMRNPQE